MNQVEISIVPEEPILEKLLAVAKGFDTFCILNSNDFYNSIAKHAAPLYHDFDIVAAFGALKVCKPETSEQNDFFELLHQFHQVENSPLFGYFSYDLKNQIEKLNSDNQDNIGLPVAYFFIPEYIIWIKENKAVIQSFTELLPMDFYQNLMRQEWEHKQAEHHSNSELCSRFSKDSGFGSVFWARKFWFITL
jgi:anthranilate/para-aminobenzoate synthase component I